MQQPDDGLQWIGTYLNTYLFQGMREVYIAIHEAVKAKSDLVLDATLPVEDNAHRVIEAVRERRGRWGH